MKLTGLHIVMIILGLATGIIHASFFPDPLFTLNGLGFIGLLGAYLLPIAFFVRRRKLVWWVFFGYTLLTMILWAVMGDKHFVFGTSSAMGYYATSIELVLAILLWFDRK